MSCNEVAEVLEAFVDGELHGCTMREVARHLATCRPCEACSSRLETLQSSICELIGADVGDFDLQPSWEAIAPELAEPKSLWKRLGEQIRALSGADDRGDAGRWARAPLWIGGTAVAALLAVSLLWSDGTPPSVDSPKSQRLAAQTLPEGSLATIPQVARTSGAMGISPAMLARRNRIDRLETPGSVRVWNQPDSGALVIWVDEEGLSVEPFNP